MTLPLFPALSALTRPVWVAEYLITANPTPLQFQWSSHMSCSQRRDMKSCSSYLLPGNYYSGVGSDRLGENYFPWACGNGVASLASRLLFCAVCLGIVAANFMLHTRWERQQKIRKITSTSAGFTAHKLGHTPRPRLRLRLCLQLHSIVALVGN